MKTQSKGWILVAAIVAVLFVAVRLIAQTTDAVTVTSTSDTCCTIRFVELSFSMGENPSARAVFEWVRSSGDVDHRDEIAVTDGDPAEPSDNFLTGNGIAPQPDGLLKALMTTPAGETGAILRRFKRRDLQWFKDHAKLSNNGITIQ